jgi:hypothetical protein
MMVVDDRAVSMGGVAVGTRMAVPEIDGAARHWEMV